MAEIDFKNPLNKDFVEGEAIVYVKNVNITVVPII